MEITMKKIRYPQFFVKRFLPITIITVTVCIIASLIFAYALEQKLQQENELDIAYTMILLNNVHNIYEGEYATKKYALSSSADSATLAEYGIDSAKALVDKESGEVICASEGILRAAVKLDDSHMKLLVCNDLEVLAFFQKYVNQVVRIDFDELYVDGEFFYPGKVRVIQLDEHILSREIGIIEEADFTPENKEAYEYYPDNWFQSYAGTWEDSQALAYLKNNVLTGNYESELENGSVSDRTIKLNNKDYILYQVYYYDFAKASGKWLVNIWAAGIIMDIMVSIVSSKRAYRRYHVQFEMNEYRRNMTNILAHDLKSPLTAISGYAENLRNNVHSEKKDYYATAVLENVKYMNHIITNALELAKIEEKNNKLVKEKVNLVVLTKELYSKYQMGAEDRGIEVNISGKGIVMANQSLFSQALENLISNAVKFTPDNGRIDILTEEKSFCIINTCEEELEGRIEDFCKPFSKGDDSRGDRNGNGLGLAIVKNIVALHGFQLQICADKGTFKVEIIYKS